MGALEDINYILSNSELTPGEKRELIAARKAQAWSDVLNTNLPYAWGVTRNGHVWNITITNVVLSNKQVTIDGVLTRDGMPLLGRTNEPPIFPISVVNPPLLAEQVGGPITIGDKTFVFAPQQVLREVILNAVVSGLA